MGQIDIKLTNTPSTPLTGKAGIYIDNTGSPRKIDDTGATSPLGGAVVFTDLIDVPSDYTGQAGKVVTVKGTEDGLEFTTGGGGSYPEAVERANNTVLFDQNYIIGNGGARSGNILFDFTGAKRGAWTEMKHADASAFTFPTETMLMFDSADISTTVDNYFLFVCTKSSAPQIVKVFHALEGGI